MGRVLLKGWRAKDRKFQKNTQIVITLLLIALWLNCLSDIILYMYPFTMAIIMNSKCHGPYASIQLSLLIYNSFATFLKIMLPLVIVNSIKGPQVRKESDIQSSLRDDSVATFFSKVDLN